MRESKRKRLQAKGWRVGSTKEFLELSDEEDAYIELRLKLAEGLRAGIPAVSRFLPAQTLQPRLRAAPRLPRPRLPAWQPWFSPATPRSRRTRFAY